MTELEQKLYAALAQAVNYIEHREAFQGRSASREEMPNLLATWRAQNANVSSIGISIGASYLPDAVIHYSCTKMLLAEVSVVHEKWKRGQPRSLKLIGAYDWEGYVSEDGWKMLHEEGRHFDRDWTGAWVLYDPEGNRVDFHWSRSELRQRNNLTLGV